MLFLIRKVTPPLVGQGGGSLVIRVWPGKRGLELLRRVSLTARVSTIYRCRGAQKIWGGYIL